MDRAPSRAYLDAVKSGYTVLPTPDRKLIILDLNGTLVWRPNRASRKYNPPELRTHLKKFTDFLFQHFTVMVWSSATPQSVSAMCDAVFTEQQRESLVAIWARDTLRLTPQEYNNKTQTFKNLEWVWTDPQIREKTGREFSQTDTIILDDSVTKVMQHPYNMIAVPTFTGDRQKTGTDTALKRVKEYLKVLRTCSNVSAYIAQQPLDFLDDPIKIETALADPPAVVSEVPTDVKGDTSTSTTR